MPTFYRQMKKAIPCLNKRAVSFVDAVAAARRYQVRITFIPNLNNDGYYVPPEAAYDGNAQIFINAKLSEKKQAKKIVHELTHHICHAALNFVLISLSGEGTSEIEKQDRFRRHKFEYEAEIIEAIAAIPQKDLKNATRGLFEIEDDDLKEDWSKRIHALLKHNI